MSQITNNKKFQSIISLIITFAVVLVLLIAGPAAAVDIDLQISGAGGDETYSYDDDETEAEFSLKVDIGDNENVPLENLTLKILGPYNKTCSFSISGANSCGNIDIIHNSNFDYSYGYGYGYGYGSIDGASPYSNVNTSFGYGYGYGGVSGISNEHSYVVTWDLEKEGIIDDEDYEGSYEARAYVTADGNPNKFVYVSDKVEFDIDAGADTSDSSLVDDGAGPESPLVTRYWGIISGGESRKIAIGDSESPLRGIQFVASEDMQGARMSVTEVDPQDFDTSDGMEFTYQAFEVEHSFTDEQIEYAVMNFSVKKSWLEENGLDASEISLYRYDEQGDQGWVQMDTKLRNSDDGLYHYSSRIDGFSKYSIGVAEKKQPTQPDEPEPEAPDEPEEEPEEEPKEQPQPEEKSEEDTGKEKVEPVFEENSSNRTMVWLIVILALLIAGIGGYFGYQRKQKK